jgi:hypothetical protein
MPAAPPLALRPDFYDLPTKQTQWRAFLRKSGLKADSSLAETIRVIRDFVMPVVEGIVKQDRTVKLWPASGSWNENLKR